MKTQARTTECPATKPAFSRENALQHAIIGNNLDRREMVSGRYLVVSGAGKPPVSSHGLGGRAARAEATMSPSMPRYNRNETSYQWLAEIFKELCR